MLPIGNTRTRVGQLRADAGTRAKGSYLAKCLIYLSSSAIRTDLLSQRLGSSSRWPSKSTREDCARVALTSANPCKLVVCCNPCAVLSLCAQLTLLIPVRRQALQPAHKRTGLDECAHRRQSNVQIKEEVAPHKRRKCVPLTGLRESPDAEKAGLQSRLLRCGAPPLITHFTLERETWLFQRAFGRMSTPAPHPGP